MDQLRIVLLGGSQIELAGQPLANLMLAKARAMFVYLAINGQPQPRTRLMDLLWSEMSTSDASRNLRVTLTQLRRMLGDYLLITRQEIAFERSQPYWLDVEEFTNNAEVRAGQVLNPDRLTHALALYTGDFLFGLEVKQAPVFEAWVLTERERLRQLALQCGERLAAHHLAVKQTKSGIAICRRLLAIEPWQESVHRQLMRLLAADGQRTAALQQFATCQQTLAEELGVAPEKTTVELYEQIRRAEVSIATDTITAPTHTLPSQQQSLVCPHNLPAPTTPFVGRDAELEQIATLLADPACRLLTVLGPGGMGKSRLALQAAQQQVTLQLNLFPDGVFYVALAAIHTFDQATPAIATALGLVFSGRHEPLAQLIAYIRSRRILLVLDNFEQLVKEAPLLTQLLQGAPETKLLVTSRQRLHLYEEWLFDLQGLPIPPVDVNHALIENYGAVQLFKQRAQRLNLRVSLASDQTAVVEICRLVQGLPLGIELAAGWVRTHSCAAIQQEIQQNLDFLASDIQNLPERQRSLRAVFDYSWRLLDETDALIFNRLTIFPGGFTLDAAQRVCSATPAGIERLVDKSLVQRASTGRFTIHEVLRHYGLEICPAHEYLRIRWEHIRFFATWVATQQPYAESAQEPQALARIADEIENIRAGWNWALAEVTNAVTDNEQRNTAISALSQYCPMLAYFLVRQNRFQEGKQMFSDAVTRIHEVTLPAIQFLRANLWLHLADFDFGLSQFAEMETLAQQALLIFEGEDDRSRAAAALTKLGGAYVRMGRYQEAEHTLQQSLQHYQAIGDHKSSSAPLNLLGNLYSNQGYFSEANRYDEACLVIFRQHGYLRGIANSLNNLGTNSGRSGDHLKALTFYRESHAIAEKLGERLQIAVALSNLGSSSRALGELADARRYFAESLALCRTIGEQRWTAVGMHGLGLTLLASGEIGAAQEQLRAALSLTLTIQSIPDTLDNLAALGEIAALTGETFQALSILKFVVDHPVTQRAARERSHQRLTKLEATVPSALINQAQTICQGAELNDLVQWILSPNCKEISSLIKPRLYR